MSKNVFKQFCSSIDYKVYSDLEKAFGVGGLGIAWLKSVVPTRDALLSNSMNGVAGVSLALFMGLVWSNGKYQTRDVNEIRKLYQEFIYSYVSLNEFLGFHNPVEIATMYSYLLYNGYLSKDKSFQFSSKGALESGELDGVNILKGNGVCRHISGMLTDILNASGIEAHRLNVYKKDFAVEVAHLDHPKYTEEELIQLVRSHVTDEASYEYVMNFIRDCISRNGCNIDIDFRMIDDKNPLKKVTGNHTITFSVQDGIGYYLDPTQGKIYRMENGILTDDVDSEVSVKVLPSIVFNSIGNFSDMRYKLSKNYPGIRRSQSDKMVKETLQTCEENTGAFEDFYNQNSTLYNDIANKVLVLKR